MKQILLSVGAYLLASLFCAGVAVVFIEGWPPFLTLAIFFAAYFFSSMLACWYFPRLWWLAFFIITSLIWIDVFFGEVDFSGAIELLKHPGKIDDRNFYFFLPWVMLIASLTGCLTGVHIAAKPKARAAS